LPGIYLLGLSVNRGNPPLTLDTSYCQQNEKGSAYGPIYSPLPLDL
jgi:hypothetical protein